MKPDFSWLHLLAQFVVIRCCCCRQHLVCAGQRVCAVASALLRMGGLGHLLCRTEPTNYNLMFIAISARTLTLHMIPTAVIFSCFFVGMLMGLYWLSWLAAILGIRSVGLLPRLSAQDSR
ncbi:unnamed protein product [Mycena citricolor]|uniref:Copper transporter n=1 Tax=Mycena citricolor TaxID=2018698 RepID=A0AAD2HIC5_9AGAR|nr:unnamed protein product [Mycena citricolor]CAK5274637.1 unnamed protein product [Mycena citricolor]